MTAKLAISKHLHSLFSGFIVEENSSQLIVREAQAASVPGRAARGAGGDVFIAIKNKTGAVIVTGRSTSHRTARQIRHCNAVQTPSFLG